MTTTNRLIDVAVASEFEVVKDLIVRNLGVNVTVDELLSLKNEEIRAIPYMGVKKYEKALAMIQSINNEFNDNTRMSEAEFLGWQEPCDPSEIAINLACLSPSEMKVMSHIGSINNKASINLSLKDVQAFDASLDFLLSPGSRLLRDSRAFIARCKSSAVSMSLSKIESDSLLYLTSLSVTLAEKDIWLATQVKNFISNLNERNRSILLKRYGFDSQPLTLKDIGDSERPTITRERVRQILVRMQNEFVLPFDSELFQQEVIGQYEGDIEDVLPEVSALFDSQRSITDFVEAFAKFTPGAFSKKIDIDLPKSIVDGLFELYPAPIDLESAIDMISSQIELSPKEIEIGLKLLAKEEIVTLSIDGVEPARLCRHIAVSQASLHYPDGAHFSDLYEWINVRGYSKTSFD